MMFASSPGQLESGDTIEGRVLPHGRFADLIRAKRGDTIKVDLALFDPAYGSVRDAHIRVKIAQEQPGCWRITGSAWLGPDYEAEASFGPALVLTPLRAPASQLRYVASSTRLIDQHSVLIGALPDGIIGHGIVLPFEIPPASEDVYYLQWLLHVQR